MERTLWSDSAKLRQRIRGEAARAGFQAVPDLLLKHQESLNLNPTELVVLLNVLMHWWYRDQKPFPRPTTIARRMGSTVRTVQRAITKLQREGLVERQRGPNKVMVLDPDPLVRRLSALAKSDLDYLRRTGGLVA
jgi:Crp-like helix-turn-helix domain